ncbi:Beta-ketoadipate pathway transcriptional regulator PcaR [Pseudomonas amygdali pv. sesami]|nr:Beta-ketoadipate pathway transcriptional regulator PcaR [Pseudomonas amygdali pv. sesami]
MSKKSLRGRGEGISIFTAGQLRLSAICSIIAQAEADFTASNRPETCAPQGLKGVTEGVSMNDELRKSFASLAPPIVASPAKRIQALTGDPDFMTSLARGLAVIHAFQERKRHLTIAQISHRTEIPRAAVRRCLHTLIKLGYATTDGRTYSLLPKVLTLGHAYLSSTPLATSSQPYLDRMSDQLHEACNMATLEGDDILYIARSATTQRLISVDLSVGGRLPAYCTSMGRILLAALDDVSLHEYLDHVDLQPKTSRTIRTPEALLECLQLVRQQGWCIVDQELEQGLRSIAVPVYDASGQVLAALNVSTSAGRVARSELEQRFLPIMLDASRDLSTQLFT